ncbi:uncharacterized protein LOC131940266 [Physella acuta]|uniref:uncharacterized protein LOC131940266 n=1 Tax=Physella acuta TaxID=109671 RepID=UPI0027DDB0B6|nr:uncharacterized protein LOC131940266 [Physella acuta]
MPQPILASTIIDAFNNSDENNELRHFTQTIKTDLPSDHLIPVLLRLKNNETNFETNETLEKYSTNKFYLNETSFLVNHTVKQKIHTYANFVGNHFQDTVELENSSLKMLINKFMKTTDSKLFNNHDIPRGQILDSTQKQTYAEENAIPLYLKSEINTCFHIDCKQLPPINIFENRIVDLLNFVGCLNDDECNYRISTFCTCNESSLDKGEDNSVNYKDNSIIGKVMTQFHDLSNKSLDVKYGNYSFNGKLSIALLEASCQTGFGFQSGACVKCRPGTYSSNNTECAVCPKGTYQAIPGSTDCFTCSEGETTKAYGSVSENDCITEEITDFEKGET